MDMLHCKKKKVLTLITFIASVITILMISSITTFADGNNSFPGVIGWDGDKDGVLAYMDGSFYVRDGKNTTYSFGIYNNPSSVKWYNDWGYLPCLITEFTRDNCTVRICNFGDRVTINNNNYVIIYSKVYIKNNGTSAVTLDPAPSSGLIALNSISNTVAPGTEAAHYYAVAADRFGNTYAWPADSAIIAAGDAESHWNHMQNFWSDKLNGIVNITQLPDPNLINAYKAGYCYTRIIHDGYDIHVGENGYDQVFDHDSIGIIATMLTLGDFSDITHYMDRLQSSLQYSDAKWKYSWPFALYIQKTGNIAYINNSFPNIQTNTHTIQSDMTGPGGIMKMTNDIDSDGYWTIDDCSALFGLTTYQYICDKLGKTSESSWASTLYNTLLTNVNNKLNSTISTYKLNYIPVAMDQPNTANRCNEPRDANWASMFLFGRWAWDGYLFGANQSGPLIDKIDDTYSYGFGRLLGMLPAHTYGGYPSFNAWYSSSYNAGYGSAGLRGNGLYRAEGILDYQFMIRNSQSSPFGWWENTCYPTPTAWGMHPNGGGGSCPHMWGQSTATKVLIDSLIAERYDGTVIVGRGVPNSWVANGQVIQLSNFPISNNGRMGIKIEGLSGNQVKLTLSGTAPGNNVIFNLPIFINNITASNAGTIDSSNGTVTIPATTTTVTVTYGSNAAYGNDPSTPSGTQTGGIVNHGIYKLTAQNSGKCLDVRNGGTGNGVLIQQYTDNITSSQRWQVNFIGGDRYYTLTAMNSGLALDVKDGSLADGGTLQQWLYIGNLQQQWQIVNLGNGIYKLVNRNSGKVLDVTWGNTTDGTLIQQYTDNGTTSQQWKFDLQ